MTIANDASPYALDESTLNVLADNVGVPMETASVLLVLVAALNRLVAAWVALNDTSPRPTIVIKLPEASMVATDVLLLVYVIAPLLSLTGLVNTEKDASPYAFEEGTVNVADERLGVLREIRRLNVVLPTLYCVVTACDAVTVIAEGVYSSIVATSPLMLIYDVTLDNNAIPSVQFEVDPTNEKLNNEPVYPPDNIL